MNTAAAYDRLERILTSWDKDDRIIYAAARQVLRSGEDVAVVALEYDVDIDELQETVDELIAYERAIDKLTKGDSDE